MSLTGLELERVRTTTTSGDLKNMTINPKELYKEHIWCMGLVRKLAFDPGEWKWQKDSSLQAPFFQYSFKRGYKALMDAKTN